MSKEIEFANEEEEKAYYQNFIKSIAEGKQLTKEQIDHHVALQNRGVKSGLDIGERAPDFELLDVHGKSRTMQDLMGPNGMVVVFSRTVNWCPYCRNHLKEADIVAPFLQEKGLPVIGITPDTVELHHTYASANDIAYPLLSDIERQAINGFGVLNGNIPRDIIGQHPDVPFPGYFVLDRDGIILDKAFLTDYQFRQSPTVSVCRLFGWQDRPGVTVSGRAFRASVTLSSDRCFAGHQLGLRCNLQPLHPWGERSGSVVVSVRLGGALIDGEHTSTLTVDGTTDQGAIEMNGVVPVRWSAPPEFEAMRGLEYLREGGLRAGSYALQVEVAIRRSGQGGALVDDESVRVELPVEILAEVPRLPGAVDINGEPG